MCGSLAAFSITVTPSARQEASIIFIVAPDAHLVEIDICAGKVRGFGLYDSARIVDRSAERLKALNVLINRPCAEITAAGHGDLRLMKAA